ncbi:hypothetical protein F5J12DRAFT_789215 [Pisolithus orientalis]|uniref:uncharacterized protein n=1 Tax=Pisolithus orientalis TaxID=936130 RepID=UPI0022245FC1|nr:uncharacterized protein F5J12DRAFT_789215 [Pisolithus orientalis]KAI5980459.1 hypothetical protein F5J12DRAFT_789215 [Pisolithus orientalis]
MVDHEVAFAAVASGSMWVWHHWLGHLHLDAIRTMVQKNIVNGLNITSPKDFDHVCEGCVLSKSHWLPFPKVSNTIYLKMELVVMDITGPIVGWLLEKKEEVASALKEVVAMLERQLGLKLKKMCSDNGTEFVNSVVESFC